MFTNHIFLSNPLSWCWRSQHPPGCPFLFPLLSRSCQGLYPLWPPWSLPPKAWWSQEAESTVRERRRDRSEAHRSEAHRLRYIDASRRAYSVISRAKSATWQTTCSNLSPRSDLVLTSGFSMPSRAKRTPPKTLLFPVAVPLLTLPITMPLIFAHIYLKRHPVPRAEPNDSSWMNSGKLAVRMLLPSTIHSAPLLLDWTPHCHLQTLLFHCIWPRPDCLSITKAFAWTSTTPLFFSFQQVLALPHLPLLLET